MFSVGCPHDGAGRCLSGSHLPARRAVWLVNVDNPEVAPFGFEV